MKTLLILGAGQYGMVAKEVAEAMGGFDKVLFLDDNNPIAVGKLCELEQQKYDVAFVAIGNPIVRKQLLERVSEKTTLIHPAATVMPSAKIGEGSIIEAGAVICSNASIGTGTIVMSNAVVGHDAKVGSYCQLKYNCSIPERSVIPDMTKVECNTLYQA